MTFFLKKNKHVADDTALTTLKTLASLMKITRNSFKVPTSITPKHTSIFSDTSLLDISHGFVISSVQSNDAGGETYYDIYIIHIGQEMIAISEYPFSS